MFLSPLNWHYAKFTSFQWKQAADAVQKRPSAPTADPHAVRPAGPASTTEPRRTAAVEER